MLAVSSVYLASAVAMVAALLVVVKYSTAFLSGSLNVLDRLPKLERKQKQSLVNNGQVLEVMNQKKPSLLALMTNIN